MGEKQDLEKLVDDFAAAMKARLETKRKAGWYGWSWMGRVELRERLLKNAADGAVTGKKLSLVDVANLAMMIWRNDR